MKSFLKWTEQDYSVKQRAIALFFEGVFFMFVIPYSVVQVSSALDQRLQLPRLYSGLPSLVVGGLLIAAGWSLAMWSVQVQFTRGRGTPVPVMATQKLIVDGPFAYCRNPMSFGMMVFHCGLGVWTGSPSLVGLVFLFATLLVLYIKLIEERELEARFGSEYVEYRRNTPFLIPRPWRKRR